ncbi:GntR family transcriptional regulator [Pelagibacterium montanilacus]|uniref:GntR family transcriptional regulator n=1 Tax=Pelagibacterium montanilacus TaxID=2185280 RepID=UPI001FE6DC3C|nr:GntR family transcriptional regulator [Pelagibacterium montanilacus]
MSDLAYQRILEKLFERELPAGAFVSQGHLVELLDIPVAPLRDALRVLEAEGVLKIHPRSGIEFIKPGLELTKSTYQFRTILERAAVRVFAETASAEDIAALAGSHEALIADIERNGLSADAHAALEGLEAQLHDAIIGVLGNPLIETSYKRMHNYLRLLRLDRRLTPPLALRSLREHMAIITACAARDPDAAEKAVQDHFSAALQRNMGLY